MKTRRIILLTVFACLLALSLSGCLSLGRAAVSPSGEEPSSDPSSSSAKASSAPSSEPESSAQSASEDVNEIPAGETLVCGDYTITWAILPGDQAAEMAAEPSDMFKKLYPDMKPLYVEILHVDKNGAPMNTSSALREMGIGKIKFTVDGTETWTTVYTVNSSGCFLNVPVPEDTSDSPTVTARHDA